MSAFKRIIAGAVGGLAGAAIMGPLHSLAIRGNNHGSPAGEDATEKVAKKVTHLFAGHTPEGAKKGGMLVHYAFGATMGALLGLASEALPGTKTGLGTLFGAAVYVGAHVVTVPLLGLAPGVVENGLAQESAELAAHLAYGVVTDRVTKLLT
jgi:putative membrane protein